MTLTRIMRTAIRALRRNIMRSVLTTLGIIIGVAAVIAMMELGNGTSSQMQKRIASLGANNLLVRPGALSNGGISWGAGTSLTLTPQDCEAINRDCPAVRFAAPMVSTSGQLIYGNLNWSPSSILGTTPAYFDVREWALEDGICFTDQDVANSAKVCIIGKTIVDSLFGKVNPLGKSLRLYNCDLKVIGVLTSKGASMWGSDQDDILILPWTTVKTRITGNGSNSPQYTQVSSASASSVSALYPTSTYQLYPGVSATQLQDSPLPAKPNSIGTILAAAQSSEDIQLAIGQITELLHSRHKIRDGQDDDFNIRDMTELGNVFTSTSRLMTTLLLIVATISLIVGGVGIMNIMLVSVTERTREIGLRMAVGARSRDILLQFLVEAILLCLAGGFIGIAMGRTTSIIVRTVLGWATLPSIPAIVISVFVSALTGIGFGFYPAWKASRLDPIEALRYE